MTSAVKAQDGDNGLQWQMEYSIVPDGESEDYFNCDSTTGDITVKAPLDRDSKSQFVITVMVRRKK